jgi:hypothetical protein
MKGKRMKFFKILSIACLVTMLSFSLAIATPPGQNKDGPGYYQHSQTGAIKYFDSHPGEPSQWKLIEETNPEDPGCGANCVSVGGFGIKAFAIGGGVDMGFEAKNGFVAGGIGAGGGLAGGKASGIVFDGAVAGDVYAVGGGFAGNTTYTFKIDGTDRSQGVGSASHAEGYTGGSVNVSVDPEKGMGYASGGIAGIAGQVTADGSAGHTPNAFVSNGFTAGLAGQGSVGGFVGYVVVLSGPDMEGTTLRYVGGHKYGFLNPKNWKCVPFSIDSQGAATVEANIDMWGNSYSESYGYVNVNEGVRTEGLGSNVGSDTHVRSSGSISSYRNGLAVADARLYGGFVAAGGATSMTQQTVPGAGAALATAQGGYVGAGTLGCDFDGVANGYTFTSGTTVEGLNGSVMTSGAGMAVSARNTIEPPAPVDPQ